MAYPAETKEWVLEFARQNVGTPVREIAERFGVGREAAYTWIRDAGIPRTGHRGPKPLHRSSSDSPVPSKYESAIAFAVAHPEWSWKRVADRFGFSHAALYQAAMSLGTLRGHYRESAMGEGTERRRIVEQAIREDWTLNELGAALGVTRERARQLKNTYDGDAKPQWKLVSLHTLAPVHGLCASTLRKLVREWNIPTQRRGESTAEYLDDASQELLAAAVKKHKAPVPCLVCGKPSHGRSNFCCQRHAASHRYEARKLGIYKPGRFIRPEYERVAKSINGSARSGKLLLRKEAIKRSGLSPMQLEYLTQLSVLNQTVHPDKTWRGIPRMAWYSGEIEVVRRVMPSLSRCTGCERPPADCDCRKGKPCP